MLLTVSASSQLHLKWIEVRMTNHPKLAADHVIEVENPTLPFPFTGFQSSPFFTPSSLDPSLSCMS